MAIFEYMWNITFETAKLDPTGQFDINMYPFGDKHASLYSFSRPNAGQLNGS